MTVAGGCLAALRFQITNQRLPISECFLNNLVNKILKTFISILCSLNVPLFYQYDAFMNANFPEYMTIIVEMIT